MTEGVTAGDSPGLWVPVADLARMRGLARQAMYRKVDRLIERGLMEARIDPRGTKLVSPAQYDHAVGQVGDLARMQGAATRRIEAPGPGSVLPLAAGAAMPPEPESSSATYTREQARKMAYSADREKIALGESLKLLVPVDRLAEEAQSLFAPMVARLDRLEGRADEIAAAVARDGVAGGRAWLKAFKIEVRNEIAAGLRALVARLSTEPERDLSTFNPSLADGAESPAPAPDPEPDD